MDIEKLEDVAENGMMKGKVSNSTPPTDVRLAPEKSDDAPVAPVSPVADGGASEDEMVSVKKSDLEAINSRLAILEKSVSVNDLAIARSQAKTPELPMAYMKVFMNKIVVGWKSEKPQLLYNPVNPNTIIGEVLKTRCYFIDGTDSGIVDQVSFTRTEDRVNVRIVEDHGQSVKVKFEKLITADADLQQSFVLPVDSLEVNKNFLNP